MRGETLLRRIALPAIAAAALLAACSRSTAPDARRGASNSQKMWSRIGDELGRLAAAVKHRGRVVVVRLSTSPETGEAQDYIEAAFRRRFGKSASAAVEIDLLAVPETPRPADAPMGLVIPRRPLDAALMGAAAAQAGPGGLIVSLMGEPSGPPPAGASWPSIVCFSSGGSTNLAHLVRAGVVAAAVAPRHTNPAADENDWYELRYTTVDRAGVDTW